MANKSIISSSFDAAALYRAADAGGSGYGYNRTVAAPVAPAPSSSTAGSSDIGGIDPTKVIPESNIAAPVVQYKSTNSTEPVYATPEGDTARPQVEGAEHQYLNANQAFVCAVSKSICQVDPEFGDAIVGKYFQQRQSDIVDVAATICDPTGSVGEACSFLYAVIKEATGPDKTRALEALSKVLEQNDPGKQSQSSGPKCDPLPYDTSGLNAPALMNLLQRCIEDDPFMKKTAQSQVTLDKMQTDKRVYEEDYLTVATPQKLIAAAGTGDLPKFNVDLSAMDIPAEVTSLIPEIRSANTPLEDTNRLHAKASRVAPSIDLEFEPETTMGMQRPAAQIAI